MLTFDDETHKYFWNGIDLPSVTTILKAENFLNTDWFTEEARLRGSIAHKATELYDHGKLDWLKVSPEISGFVTAWERFRKVEGFVPAQDGIEKRVHHFDQYAGTVDRLGTFGSELGLIDLKTGPKYPWWILQMAGYLEAISSMTNGETSFHNVRCACIQLKTNGDYRVHSYAVEDVYDAREIFLASLNVFKWKHSKKIYNSKNELTTIENFD